MQHAPCKVQYLVGKWRNILNARNKIVITSTSLNLPPVSTIQQVRLRNALCSTVLPHHLFSSWVSKLLACFYKNSGEAHWRALSISRKREFFIIARQCHWLAIFHLFHRLDDFLSSWKRTMASSISATITRGRSSMEILHGCPNLRCCYVQLEAIVDFVAFISNGIPEMLEGCRCYCPLPEFSQQSASLRSCSTIFYIDLLNSISISAFGHSQ